MERAQTVPAKQLVLHFIDQRHSIFLKYSSHPLLFLWISLCQTFSHILGQLNISYIIEYICTHLRFPKLISSDITSECMNSVFILKLKKNEKQEAIFPSTQRTSFNALFIQFTEVNILFKLP